MDLPWNHFPLAEEGTKGLRVLCFGAAEKQMGVSGVCHVLFTFGLVSLCLLKSQRT